MLSVAAESDARRDAGHVVSTLASPLLLPADVEREDVELEPEGEASGEGAPPLCVVALEPARPAVATSAELERIRRERDLYRRLTLLGEHEDLERFLADALAAIVVFPAVALSPQALSTLRAMEWPGHVRQLEHAVEAAVIRAAGHGARRVERAHLTTPTEHAAGPGGPTFQEATRRFQAELVQQTLEECGWNVVEAARRLDVARSHLYNLIRAFGIARVGH